MPNPQKIEAVKELAKQLKEADATLLSEFRGMKVQEMKELRRRLTDEGAVFRVVKNSITRLAVKDAQIDDLLPLLEGSTAITFIKGDPIPAAKGLDEISKKFPTLVVKGAFVDGKVLGAEAAQALAKVLSREESLGRLAGMLQAPTQRLALLLSASLRNLGYALGAYQTKLAESAPAADSGADVAPATDSGADVASASDEGRSRPTEGEESSATDSPALRDSFGSESEPSAESAPESVAEVSASEATTAEQTEDQSEEQKEE